MTLTRELVARAAGVVEDEGPPPGTAYMSDEDCELAVREIIEHAPQRDTWLFAYGSLLWKPECEVADSRRAVVRGWHRAYRIRLLRLRGTVSRPGLMMSLDRGGQCHGMVSRLIGDVRASLHKLLRRELVMKPSPQRVRWLSARTAQGFVPALGFVVNPHSDRYVGKLEFAAVAEVLASAAGHLGSCAEYLHETVARLEDLGIHDRNLWRLQEAVAKQILQSVGKGR